MALYLDLLEQTVTCNLSQRVLLGYDGGLTALPRGGLQLLQERQLIEQALPASGAGVWESSNVSSPVQEYNTYRPKPEISVHLRILEMRPDGTS